MPRSDGIIGPRFVSRGWQGLDVGCEAHLHKQIALATAMHPCERLKQHLRCTQSSWSICAHCTTNFFRGGGFICDGLLRANMRSQTRAQARTNVHIRRHSRLTYGAPIVRGRQTAAAAEPWAPTLLCLRVWGGWHVRREHMAWSIYPYIRALLVYMYISSIYHVCVYIIVRSSS